MSRSRWGLLLGLSTLGAWLLWPLIRPLLVPTSGTTLVVVFDGYHRLDAALARTPPRQPLLLIRCPSESQPSAAQLSLARQQGRVSFSVLGEGYDSATQITALARWLRHLPVRIPPVGQLLLVSDDAHLQRLIPATQVAVGGEGVRVSGLATDIPGQSQPVAPWPIVRDWWRLQLWRLSGTTGAFLVPDIQQQKRNRCGLRS